MYDENALLAGTIVWADADKLRQVLLNILANAVRFTPHGGRITVDLSAGWNTADVVYLRIQDTGVGIPREEQDVIFDPFVQLNQTFGRATEGTGLGLTISRPARCEPSIA